MSRYCKSHRTWVFCLLLLFYHQTLPSLAEISSTPFKNVTLDVKSDSTCVFYGQFLDIQCNLTYTGGNNMSDLIWSLTWPSSLDTNTTHTTQPNAITARLTVQVKWRYPKNFTCVATCEKGNISKTITIAVKPGTVTGVYGKFVETKRGNSVEISWKPSEDQTPPTDYYLRYCLDVEIEDLEEGFRYACPQYAQKSSTCSFEGREPECRSFIPYDRSAPTRIVHKISIVRSSKGTSGCESQTETQYTLYNIPPMYPSNYGGALVLIPYLVIKLEVTTSLRHVFITWSDPKFVYRTRGASAGKSTATRFYTVYYNCSNSGANLSRGTSESNMTLYEDDFQPYRPYDSCIFCVKAKITKNGPASEPVCTVTRLQQERPSSAPVITRQGSGIDRKNVGKRNVTITWTLPPRQTWNGVLVKVVVLYRQGNSSVTHTKTEYIIDNVTEGRTVLTNMDTRSSYVIQMVACTVVGCSHTGNTTLIDAVPVPMTPAVVAPSRGDSGKLILGIAVVGSVGIVMLVILLLIFCWHKRSQSDKEGRLPTISEPKDYDNPAVSISAEYCELEIAETDVEQNEIRTEE